MSGCFTNVGKQVLANGVHYADAADLTAAVAIVAAMNRASQRTPPLLPMTPAVEAQLA